jgi:hypothetical protein
MFELGSSIGRDALSPMDRPSFLLFVRTVLPERASKPHRDRAPEVGRLDLTKNSCRPRIHCAKWSGALLKYLASPPRQIGQRLAGYRRFSSANGRACEKHISATVKITGQICLSIGVGVSALSQTAMLGEDGSFGFNGLAKGSYTIFASVRGYGMPRSVTLGLDSDVSDYVLTLKPR